MKTRTKKLYGIRYSEMLKQYILFTIVCDISLYKRFYSISEKEYYYSTKKLDKIANQCKELKFFSFRYLCSEKREENNEYQKEIYIKISKEINDSPEKEIIYF